MICVNARAAGRADIAAYGTDPPSLEEAPMSDQFKQKQPEQGERAEEQLQDLSIDAVQQARGGDLTDVRGGFSKIVMEYAGPRPQGESLTTQSYSYPYSPTKTV